MSEFEDLMAERRDREDELSRKLASAARREEKDRKVQLKALQDQEKSRRRKT